MQNEPTFLGGTEEKSGNDSEKEPVGSPLDDDRRLDTRYPMQTPASVTGPGVPGHAYVIRNVSRGGMFLAFCDADAASAAAISGIHAGATVQITFAIVVGRQKQYCAVRAIVRHVDHHGLGVAFERHDPPEIGALRALFCEHTPAGPARHAANDAAVPGHAAADDAEQDPLYGTLTLID